MKKTSAFLYFFIFSCVFSMVANAELASVPYVDVQRYIGRWYQIANNPMPFDKNCFCSQQTLSVLDTGDVGVYNSCNRNSINGPLTDIRGTAKNVNPQTNSQFIVDFGLPQLGDYWIVGLDADYRWAIVSEPSKKSLFILSKTPTLDPVLYEKALDAVRAQKISLENLNVTEHRNCKYPALNEAQEGLTAEEGPSQFKGEWNGTGVYRINGVQTFCKGFNMKFDGNNYLMNFLGGERKCDQHEETFVSVSMAHNNGKLFYNGKEIGAIKGNLLTAQFSMPDPAGGVRHWRMSMRKEGNQIVYEESRRMNQEATPMIGFAGLLTK